MIRKRIKPSFIIIGGVKCASTSLFRYLIEHPNVLPGAYKEPGFFNHKNLIKALVKYPKYLRNFPFKSHEEQTILNWPILNLEGKITKTKIEKNRIRERQYTTGEASATYNFSANPFVIKTILPKVKILFLLRNPTQRFISHWRMFKRFDDDGKKGYDVGDLVPFIKNEITSYQNNHSTRLVHQGMYYDIIKKWKKHFDSDHFFLLRSTDLSDSEKAIGLMNKINDYLNLPSFEYSNILAQKFNVAPRIEKYEEAENLLNTFYEESNGLLLEHFNIDMVE